MSLLYKRILKILVPTLCGVFGESAASQLVPLDIPDSKETIHLIIENQNKKKLNLLVKPQLLTHVKEIPVFPRKVGWMALTVPPASDEMESMDSEFVIPLNELGKSQYYSITGETNPLTPTGTCYNLQPGKCYKIKFTNNMFGTDCICSEIKGPIPHVKGRPILIPSRKATSSPLRNSPLQPERPSDVLTARESEYYP